MARFNSVNFFKVLSRKFVAISKFTMVTTKTYLLHILYNYHLMRLSGVNKMLSIFVEKILPFYSIFRPHRPERIRMSDFLT